ncbi:MAG: 3-oxoacyl-ACP reductase FabG [Alphaproteobacteria bacterium]
MTEEKPLRDKRALVTGGSGAIGGAICRQLAALGAHVVVHGNRNVARADSVADAIKRAGDSAEAIGFDVTDNKAAKDAAEKMLAGGPIQIFVSNAGFFRDAPMAGMSETTWRSVIDVSLNGFYNVAQPLLLPMLRTRWGRIIAITSVSGIMGNRGQSNYAAAKAGLHGAVKSLSQECASRGVTVNAVAPGVILTDETAKLFPAERIRQLIPMQRAGTPEEVADLVGFLASPKAAYISGQIVAINGGMA